jgi:hypothetical protein
VEEQSNNAENPPGLLLEIVGRGESTGVHNKTPGVYQETPGVCPKLYALENPEPYLNEEPDGTYAIEANTVTSNDIVNKDDDDDHDQPPMGGGYESSDDDKEYDDEQRLR